MALTLEDGTGVTGADSFVTAADAAVIEAEYFGAATIADTPAGEAALRRAWVYMSALDWLPDTYVTFGGAIPADVVAAQVVFARFEVAETGFLSPAEALVGRKVLNRAGSIGWDVQRAPLSVDAARPVVTMGFDLLSAYLSRNPSKSGGTKDLLRA